jgi:hypothetical protein
LTGLSRRRRSLAARTEGWGSTKGFLRTCASSESGGGSSQWRRDGSLRPAAEGGQRGRALVVLGGEKVVGELAGDVGKLSAAAIGGEKG